MIDATMAFLAERLNAHCLSLFQSPTDLVLLSPLVGVDGSFPPQAHDKLAVTLVHLQQERIASNRSPAIRSNNEGLVHTSAPIALNLDVLISANFDDSRYDEALRLLGAAIGYFHDNPIFTKQSAPNLPTQVSKLDIAWIDRGLTESHNMWTALGTHHRPSVLYKVRMRTIEHRSILRDGPAIAGVDVES